MRDAKSGKTVALFQQFVRDTEHIKTDVFCADLQCAVAAMHRSVKTFRQRGNRDMLIQQLERLMRGIQFDQRAFPLASTESFRACLEYLGYDRLHTAAVCDHFGPAFYTIGSFAPSQREEMRAQPSFAFFVAADGKATPCLFLGAATDEPGAPNPMTVLGQWSLLTLRWFFAKPLLPLYLAQVPQLKKAPGAN